MAPEPLQARPQVFAPLACLAAGTLFFFIAPDFCNRYAEWFFLLSIPVFGIPHGSADLLLAEKHYQLQRWSWPWLRYFSGYTALALAFIVLALLFPVITGMFFILLTSWHWGHGDECMLSPIRPTQRVLACCKGLVVMSAAIYSAPEVASHMLRLTNLTEVTHHITSYSLLVLFSSGMSYLILLKLSHDIQRCWFKTLELILIIALFSTAPVFYALAIYFMMVHSGRHLLLLSYYLDRTLSGMALLNKLLVLHVQILPVTILACAIMALTFQFSHHFALVDDMTQVYFSCLLGLTVPHVLLWESWRSKS